MHSAHIEHLLFLFFVLKSKKQNYTEHNKRNLYEKKIENKQNAA